MTDNERLTNLERQVRLLRRTLALLVIPCLAAIGLILGGWRDGQDTVRAKKLEITDGADAVRLRAEPGKFALLNKAGEEKAVLTADDNNGNITLNGSNKMRATVFMSDESPVLVIYNSKGDAIASLPMPKE